VLRAVSPNPGKMPSGTGVLWGEVSLIDNVKKYTTSSLQNWPIDPQHSCWGGWGRAVLADAKSCYAHLTR